MKKEKLIKLSPLIILQLASVYLLITVMTTDVTLVKWHIVGLVFLGIVTTTQLFNEKYGYWMTAFLLIFATFSFAAFTPTIYFLKIAIIKIDPLGFLTMMLFVIVHRKEIPDWIDELRTDDSNRHNNTQQ